MTTKTTEKKLIAAASKLKPELVALAEVLQIAVPGLKMPHATMAATIERMLNKRGFDLCRRAADGETA